MSNFLSELQAAQAALADGIVAAIKEMTLDDLANIGSGMQRRTRRPRVPKPTAANMAVVANVAADLAGSTEAGLADIPEVDFDKARVVRRGLKGTTSSRRRAAAAVPVAGKFAEVRLAGTHRGKPRYAAWDKHAGRRLFRSTSSTRAAEWAREHGCTVDEGVVSKRRG